MTIHFFLGFLGLLCLLIYTYLLQDRNDHKEHMTNIINKTEPIIEKSQKGCVKNIPKKVGNIIKIREEMENKRNISKFIDYELNFPVTSQRTNRVRRCRHC